MYSDNLADDDSAIKASQLEKLIGLQQSVLAKMATGADTQEILETLCQLSELLLPNAVASIMLLNETRDALIVRCAPSVPTDAIAQLNGLVPGSHAGSCGTAVFSEQPVFVADISTDRRWESLRGLAAQYGLHACWSIPIRMPGTGVAGSFALTSMEKRKPNHFHRRLLEVCAYLTGITLAEDRQRDRLALADTAISHMAEGLMITDAAQRIMIINQAFSDITGYSEEEVLGNTPDILSSGLHDENFFTDFWQALEDHGRWSGEIYNQRKNGEVFPQWVSVRAVSDRDGRVQNYVTVMADISELKDSERKLWHQAHHDALTRLPNRKLLHERLLDAISAAHDNGTRCAVIFIDLDHFKNINDSLGHHKGDELLIELARRLRAVIKGNDTLARLSGDEFVVVLPNLQAEHHATDIASRLRDEVEKPFMFHGRPFYISSSIGIAFFPEHGTTSVDLLKHADTAMYEAKQLGRNRIVHYTPLLGEKLSSRLQLEGDLRHALERGEFVLHYQAIFDARTNEPNAVEVLIRWQHPERGLIHPDAFIPAAESTGIIRELGTWVIETAARQCQAWSDQGIAPLRLSINLSPVQLEMGCTAQIVRAIRETGFPLDWLDLELTESVFMEKDSTQIDEVANIRKTGIRLAMDDFGTGYSSLGQLKQLPINKLKIDRSFVDDIPNDPNDTAIAAAIIAMGHSLGLRVVAEGVETEEQRAWLVDAGCDQLQGYLLARPVPATEFGMFLRRYHRQH